MSGLSISHMDVSSDWLLGSKNKSHSGFSDRISCVKHGRFRSFHTSDQLQKITVSITHVIGTVTQSYSVIVVVVVFVVFKVTYNFAQI